MGDVTGAMSTCIPEKSQELQRAPVKYIDITTNFATVQKDLLGYCANTSPIHND